MCRAHVEGWERSHGCSLVQYLHLNGSFVPPWLEGEGAQPGQRGSTAALAAAAVPIADKTEDRDVAGLLLDGGGEDALEEVAGRGAFVAEVPLAGSSAMDLDDDDELDNGPRTACLQSRSRKASVLAQTPRERLRLTRRYGGRRADASFEDHAALNRKRRF